MANKLPDAYFGPPDVPPINWRKKVDIQDLLDDDQELASTPKDVIELLGFDPKEFK